MASSSPASPAASPVPSAAPAKTRKLSFKEQRELDGLPDLIAALEAEQKEILKVVRRLADEGQIVLGGKGDEQMV